MIIKENLNLLNKSFKLNLIIKLINLKFRIKHLNKRISIFRKGSIKNSKVLLI